MVQPRSTSGNYLVTGVELRGLTFGQVSGKLVVTGRNRLADKICEVLNHINLNATARNTGCKHSPTVTGIFR